MSDSWNIIVSCERCQNRKLKFNPDRYVCTLSEDEFYNYIECKFENCKRLKELDV